MLSYVSIELMRKKDTMLKKITIDNFKSLKHLEYDCAGLNLLTGMNGAGKSSFIQMLRLMQKSADEGMGPQTAISIKEFGDGVSMRDFTYCYGDACTIGFSVGFESSGTEPFVLKRIVVGGPELGERGCLMVQHPDYRREYVRCYKKFMRLQHQDATVGDVHSEELDNAEHTGDAEFAHVFRMMKDDETNAARVFRGLWRGARFVDAFRVKPMDVHTGGRYTTLHAVFDELAEQPFDAEGQDVAEYICRSQSGNAANDLLNRLNACLDWVSPGAHLSVKEQDVGGQEYFVESVRFGSGAAARQYKPQNVGFGISYILPVLVTLLSAKPGSILIIENPEAHLHPSGQSEMGKLIAETVARGVQVFVETHSDHVINGIRVAVKKGIVKPEDVNIAFFERGPHDVLQADGTTRREIYSEVTNIKVDANGSLSEWPKDFMDEWGIQQMKLLRP